jgi:hypothetical protein
VSRLQAVRIHRIDAGAGRLALVAHGVLTAYHVQRKRRAVAEAPGQTQNAEQNETAFIR